MRIAFSGHRDKIANPNAIYHFHDAFPDAIWITGGAKGFDDQVQNVAKSLGITNVICLPNYRLGRSAPLARNSAMIAQADCLVACWDDREYGGTYDTIKKARKKGIPIYLVLAHECPTSATSTDGQSNA